MTTEPVGVPSLDSAVSIGFEQSVLGEGAMAPVATVIFTGQTQGSLTGTILLRANDTSPLSSRNVMPYEAREIPGTQDYARENTTFYTMDAQQPANVQRTVSYLIQSECLATPGHT